MYSSARRSFAVSCGSFEQSAMVLQDLRMPRENWGMVILRRGNCRHGVGDLPTTSAKFFCSARISARSERASANRVTRAIAYVLVNVYAIKMAAVFMFSTSTVTLFTGLAPRWIAFLGFGLAAIVLFVGQSITWSIFILPAWMFLISTYILIDNLWPRDEAAPLAS